MSNFEQGFNTTENDIKILIEGYSSRILNANLAHPEYTVAQTTFRVLSDIKLYLQTVKDFIHKNPDAEIPKTFLPSPETTSDSEQESSGATVHKVDIDSGVVSQGSN